ncbi:MAG: DNA internalization-related competence protein ComEC/Rec2 [Ignavibacteriae bacterium]|nr:MAG: DNA internalization-related competence protein ComEC/Rec2 [Ignavibacteriota bacterium]
MKDFPVIQLALIIIFGFLFQDLFNIEILTLSITVLIALTLLILLNIKKLNNIIIYILIFVIIFLLSAIYFTLRNNNCKYPFEKEKIRNVKVVGIVKNVDLIGEKKLSIKIELLEYDSLKLSDKTSNIFKVNFWKDTTNLIYNIYEHLNINEKINFIGTITNPKNMRNPSEFDYRKYLNSKNVAGVINCYNMKTVSFQETEKLDFKNIVLSVRKSINKRISELYPNKAGHLLKGILLADRSDINYNIQTDFVNSGVIHVLAVSGLHVGFVMGIFYLLFGRLDIRVRYIFTIFGVLSFLIITGTHASVFRASTMAVIYLLAKLSNRSINGFNEISIAALIILLLNPYEIFNPGFQLSFSAVLSILIIYPIFSKKIKKLKVKNLIKKLFLFISVSVAAQIGTLPFTIFYFNKLSLISIFTNVLVIPLVGIIVAIGILSLLISVLFVSLALYFAATNTMLIDLLYYFIRHSSSLKFSHLNIFNLSILDGIIFYIFIGIILYSIKSMKNKIIIGIISILLFFAFMNLYTLDDVKLLADGKLSVTAIDIGQGDSFLIKFPNSQTALIDAGNSTEFFDCGERIIFPFIQSLKIDTIDYAFISHLDSDHYAGFIYLIKNHIVKNVYLPKASSIKDSIFKDFLNFYSVPYKFYCTEKMSIGNTNLYFLNDTTKLSYKNFDINNKSGIIKLVYGKTSFLFTGDAEFEREEALIKNYGEFLKSDYLKVGHHGSKGSTSEKFIKYIAPKFAVISAGIANRFNHPSERVLNLLNEQKIEISRTDKEGAVIYLSDGEKIKKVDWRNLY